MDKHMKEVGLLGMQIQEYVGSAGYGSKEEYTILEIMQKINERIDALAFGIKNAGGTSRQLEQHVSPPASQQVTELEKKYELMSDLCGHIIATITANFQRGSLTVHDPASEDNRQRMADDFTEMLDKWKQRFEQAG